MPCVTRWQTRVATAALLAIALGAGRSPDLSAQPDRPTPATLAALDAYPTFFHRRPVLVRAAVEGDLQDVFITDGQRRFRALNVVPPVAGDNPPLEIVGTFWDVGRLAPDDPRLADSPIAELSERLFDKPWPASGELALLIARDTRRADEPDGVTLWSIALEPGRYRDQTVTVTGRFRGRNLFGDLPAAPGTSPHDFVLQSANAAVWIVGKEPRGEEFDLDVLARVDTDRWLEVTGTVRGSDRLVEIEADEIEEARPAPSTPEPTRPEEPDEAAEARPAPEVIFSAPTPDDTRVPTDAVVRVQFSRDMDPDSFGGHVEVGFLGAAPPAADLAGGEAAVAEVAYQARTRVLNIRFTEPLLPYRTIEVRLGSGIVSTDGTALVPYVLRFSTGGG